jgi:hypothetical protein
MTDEPSRPLVSESEPASDLVSGSEPASDLVSGSEPTSDPKSARRHLSGTSELSRTATRQVSRSGSSLRRSPFDLPLRCGFVDPSSQPEGATVSDGTSVFGVDASTHSVPLSRGTTKERQRRSRGITRSQQNSSEALRLLEKAGVGCRVIPLARRLACPSRKGDGPWLNSWIEVERRMSLSTDPAHFRRAAYRCMLFVQSGIS